MRILEVSVRNYKSLRRVEFAPASVSVVVGANGSGKTNFADAFDFLSEVYRHGLEVAIARKGGYENIAHRKKRRTKMPIAFGITVSIDANDLTVSHQSETTSAKIYLRHTFSFGTQGQSIGADFAVVNETLLLFAYHDKEIEIIANISRIGQQINVRPGDAEAIERLLTTSGASAALHRNLKQFRFIAKETESVPVTELFTVAIGRFLPVLRRFVSRVGEIRVFQISPVNTRQYGVPIPKPELDRSGTNLPSVVRLLQTQYGGHWAEIMDAMTRIMPGLERIEVAYTPTRELGLYFHERGSGRPWSVSEISDGTIQTLALLVAILDPRPTYLVVEEPENSVHPWIIRNVLDACNKDSTKQILITTHSPIVLNAVPPSAVSVMWRAGGESKLSRLVDLDPDFLSLWQSGTVGLYDYLDSGAIAQALPPSPVLDQGDNASTDSSGRDDTDIEAPNVALLDQPSEAEPRASVGEGE